tara:strand:- start:331 stop:816 length:486 start_codon:yes stop_codon:yes gene_type:complete
MGIFDSINNKKTMTNLIKFNHDKTVEIKKVEVIRSIIVSDKEGYLARNSAFTEFFQDKLFGFIKQKPEKIKGCFIVREGAADPLEFREDSIYGKEVTPDDIVYHEDENVAISSSDVELSNGTGPDYIQRGLVVCLTVESVAVLILALAVGLPKFISNFAGG